MVCLIRTTQEHHLVDKLPKATKCLVSGLEKMNILSTKEERLQRFLKHGYKLKVLYPSEIYWHLYRAAGEQLKGMCSIQLFLRIPPASVTKSVTFNIQLFSSMLTC